MTSAGQNHAPEQAGALSHLRVLDLGIITAGAATSQLLADFGADVIKVEATAYLDPFRAWSQISGTASVADPDASPPFRSVNRNKRGLAIDLKSPRGRGAFLDLVAVSDLVIENFRRGVLDRLGIGFDALVEANPRIVLLSLSSQGLTGPERNFVSFGSSLEASGGLMSVTGYGPDEPLWTGNNVNYPDQLVSIAAPAMALAGLRLRDQTDEAVHIDFPQREMVTSTVGEMLLARSTQGASASPLGDRDEIFAPQGVYPAAGKDQWVAISITDDAEWLALCDALDLVAERADDTLLTASGRRAAHDRLDGAIAQRTQTWDKDLLAEALQRQGVPASSVRSPREVLEGPQLAAVGGIRRAPDDPIVQRGFAARLSRTPGAMTRSAPKRGEHSREILAGLLEYSDATIDALVADGVVLEPPR